MQNRADGGRMPTVRTVLLDPYCLIKGKKAG